MSLLLESSNFGKALPSRNELAFANLDKEGVLAIKRASGRVQHLETACHAITRAVGNRASDHRLRVRRIDMSICATGLCGGAIVLLAQFYSIVPYDHAFIVTTLGLVLLTLPIIAILWPDLKDRGAQASAFLEIGIRARTQAALTKKLAQALEHARLQELWTDESRKLFEWLLGTIESEVGKSTQELGIEEIRGRKHKRIVPRQRKVSVKTRDGRLLTGQIADISLSGVALSEQLPRVALKDEVLINGRAATIVRIWASGVALEFKQHLKPETFNEDLVL